MRGALCVATRLYILYQAADESISGWEFLLIPKSPHGAETFLKMEKGTSAHRISGLRNVDEICQKIKIIKSNFSANP